MTNQSSAPSKQAEDKDRAETAELLRRRKARIEKQNERQKRVLKEMERQDAAREEMQANADKQRGEG